jgi:hypothetical protein
MAQFEQRVSTDRFGNPYVLKTAYQVENRKTGEIVNSFKTYFEIGSQLYKVEISERLKESKNGKNGMWVKFTKVKKQSATNQRF